MQCYDFRMRSLRLESSRVAFTAFSLVLISLFSSCGGPEPESDSELEVQLVVSPERFVWTDQPIVFAPPPAEWARHRWQEGALLGVSFQIPRVPPGRILVAEYHRLYRKHSRISVATGRKLEFEPARPGSKIEDVVDRVLFDPSSMPMRDSVKVGELTEREVAGYRALSLDYTWNDGRSDFTGREVYVMAHDRLFVAKLLGTNADLELFEQVVSTIGFPERESDEDGE